MSLIEKRKVPILYVGASIALVLLFIAGSLSYIIPQLGGNGSVDEFRIGMFLIGLVAIATILFVKLGKKPDRKPLTTALR
jgi:hypothetical protein